MDHLVLDRQSEQQIASSKWVVAASLYQARLLRFHTPKTKSCRFEERDRIEAPMSAGAYDRYPADPGSIRKPYQDRYQQLQTEYRRFARQLSHWLKKAARDEGLEQITVFAPAQLMQGLQHLSDVLSPTEVNLRTGNLMNAYDDELRRHPAILGLFNIQQTGRPDKPRTALPPMRPSANGQQSSDTSLRKNMRPWHVFSPISNTV